MKNKGYEIFGGEGGKQDVFMGDLKMANITRLESIAARKTLRLRKLDFHIVKNIRIKIYTKEKKADEQNCGELIHHHIHARAIKMNPEYLFIRFSFTPPLFT